MKKLKLLSLFLAGLLAGTISTGYCYSRILVHQMSSKEVDLAFQAAEQAEWLAQLRLNQPQTAIQQLEKSMEILVFTLSQWEEVTPLKSEIRDRRK